MNPQIFVFLAVSSIAAGVLSLSGYGAEEARERNAADHAYFERGYDATPRELAPLHASAATTTSAK